MKSRKSLRARRENLPPSAPRLGLHTPSPAEKTQGETRDTCSAAAGTFLLEFAALSRLTGDPAFERAARRAVEALWVMRSPVGLVGGGVRGASGSWTGTHASIGAGTDSFYEYLQKSAELLGDRGMGLMFEEAYAAVEKHLVWHGWHVEMDLYRGNQVWSRERSGARSGRGMSWIICLVLCMVHGIRGGTNRRSRFFKICGVSYFSGEYVSSGVE